MRNEIVVLRYHWRKLDKVGSTCSDSSGGEGRHSEHAEPWCANYSGCKPLAELYICTGRKLLLL